MDKRDLIQQEINGLQQSKIGKVTDTMLISINDKRMNSKPYFVYDGDGNFIKLCYGNRDVKKLTGLTVTADSDRKSLKWIIKTEYLGEKIPSKIKEKSGKKPKKVLQYTIDGEFVKEWESYKIAAKELNVHPNAISIAARGKQKTSAGFIWKYKD
jgi:hypothetical protein